MSKAAAPDFNLVASIYQRLEKIVYGPDMQRARVCHLPQLSDCKSILCVGEGDGRFLAKLLETNPHSHVTCVEASSRMIVLAKERIQSEEFKGRVDFHNLIIEQFESNNHSFDAIITNYFLDTYAGNELSAMIQKLTGFATQDTLWLVNDFTVPASGIRRLRAKLLLKIMYLFFRLTSNLRTQRLENPSRVLTNAGWKLASEKNFNHRFIVSRLWKNVLSGFKFSENAIQSPHQGANRA
jgi:ubiquinone/menaquinone biosynthesis C-methylase UbiE